LKRRITIAAEGIDSSCAPVEDAVGAVVPTRVQSRTELIPKTCKRRRTVEPEKTLNSGGRNAESTKEKVPAVVQLDTDVTPITAKHRRIGNVMPLEDNAAVIVDTNQGVPTRKKSGRLSALQPVVSSQDKAESRRRTTATCSSVPNAGSDDEVMFVESVAVEVTSSFVPVKRDNNRSAEPITLVTGNVGEPASIAPLDDVEPSTLPANFTTIFERSTPLQFRHRLDYNSFNSMLLNRLPENGLHALTLDLRKVSMLKITKFVDTVKEAVEEICEELRTRRTLSKAEIKKEIDLSGEVQQLITSRYVESMMKMADACSEARDVPIHVIADRFVGFMCARFMTMIEEWLKCCLTY
ncbi:hypothetical protein ANCCAN_26992, partial [Ancylostoma caninum]